MAETTEQYRNRINQLKTSIENEPYMKNMRPDIAEGISKTGNRQADIEVRQDTLEDDFVAVQQDASSASPSGAEVAIARAGFNTLDERLTKKEQEVTAQFARTPSFPTKLGEVGVIGESYPYGDVKRYGATGVYDENTDDTLFFQNAIDSAYAIKETVNVSAGIYTLKNTLYLPDNIRIICSASKTSYRGNTDGVSIQTYALEVFKPKGGINCRLTMDNIYAYNRSGSHYAVLFSGFNFVHAKIMHNHFHFYGTILLSGFQGLSIFEGNDVQGIGYAFATSSNHIDSGVLTVAPSGIHDAFIHHNYINGDTNNNAVAFDVNISNTSIHSNYIDFLMYGFVLRTGLDGVMIHGNTFDFCYRVFVGTLIGTVITSNNFRNSKKTEVSRFPNATEEMKTKDWGIFMLDGSHQDNSEGYGFNRITIANNSTTLTDTFLLVRGRNKHNVKVIGNIYNGVTKKIDYLVAEASWLEGDQSNIFIDDLMYKEYTTLPSSLLTGDYIESFNKQIILYKNKMLININGKWIDSNGQVFIS